MERDGHKWFKPAKGQFQIYYKLGAEQPEYVPDFVGETETQIFMVKTKARVDIDSQEVQANAAAAVRWCQYASEHAPAEYFTASTLKQGLPKISGYQPPPR